MAVSMAAGLTAAQESGVGPDAETVMAFRQRVAPGQIVKPWLCAGPFYEDVSASVQGLTLFERPGASVGAMAMAEIVAEAASLLAGTPREGDAMRFRSHVGVWTLARRPEEYLSWGTYNIANHLAAVFLSTQVTPEQPGHARWRLTTRLTSRAVVAVNGVAVFDTGDAPFAASSRGTFEYHFEAALRGGPNTITVAVFRIARMAQVGMRLDLDTPVTAEVPLGEGIDEATRYAAERALRGLSLERDLFTAGQPITVVLASDPPAGVTLRARLVKPGMNREQNGPMGPRHVEVAEGRTLHEVALDRAGAHVLARPGSLPDGTYQVVCEATLPGGSPVGVTFDVRTVTPAPAPHGYEQLSVRKQLVLEHYARTPDSQYTHSVIWPAVAQYAAGKAVDEALIAWVCDFIAARKDCADFAIQGILRLLSWEQRAEAAGKPFRLSAGLRALMKDTLLGFKYWVDEPGDTVMYMGSENHRLLFHVAEWLAGQLFPLEEFTNSRQRGLYHATKGRTYIAEWLRQRGRFGYDEWHSNSYFPIDIAPLLNVYDFAIAEDSKLRQMAGTALDHIFFILAADTFEGVFGTTHGRSYGVNIKYPELEGTAATCWLLYGTGALVHGTSGMSPVSIATSAYALPELFSRIALDKSAVVESKQRHGILPGTLRHANFVVYRTPEYQLSGLQDHRKGEYESSTHVAQVTLGNGAVIFWSCPQTIGEGSGLRPDYWSGHAALPRVIQHRNVLSLTWRPSPFAWMTHCFFEQARFDEVRFVEGSGANESGGAGNSHNASAMGPAGGRWAFARVGSGYAGIWSQHGFHVGQGGQFAGRELVCPGAENTWLVECGREADWGSFDAFVKALSGAEIVADQDTITYTSPSIGRFVTGWDVQPTVAGEAIQLRGYPLVESPWAHSAFGSGELTITYQGERHDLWFNQ